MGPVKGRYMREWGINVCDILLGGKKSCTYSIAPVFNIDTIARGSDSKESACNSGNPGSVSG